MGIKAITLLNACLYAKNNSFSTFTFKPQLGFFGSIHDKIKVQSTTIFVSIPLHKDNKVFEGKRIVGYDNERGKGDHKHIGYREEAYRFVNPQQLMVYFMADVRCERN